MELLRRTMMMVVWRVILVISLISTVAVPVLGQIDRLGFISIDCGIPESSSYVDSTTTLPYTSDKQFIDTGANHNISGEYITPSLFKQYLTVRSFPSGARNCYTLKSLKAGVKYLVRATFLYANYDGLNTLPVFDLHVGVDYWRTANISDAGKPKIAEIVLVAPAEYLQVCLVNTGQGTPFISGLDLRPLKPILYPAANANQSLNLVARLNMGPTDDTLIIRYPHDTRDRIWLPWSNEPFLTEISTTSTVWNLKDDSFEVPSAIMQTAVTPVNSSDPIQFYWIPGPQDNNPGYIHAMHISELEDLNGTNALREFNIFLNDKLWYKEPFRPDYLYSDQLYSEKPLSGYSRYNVSIAATSNSTLPPIINAFELFTALQLTWVTTDHGDVSAIAAIKAQYQLKRNWMGDPCAPKAYAWDGLNCTYLLSNSSRITTLNLSYSGLIGNITTSFADLKALQYLDLSHNNLTGAIPDVLSQLPSLKLLDLTSNQLNGPIPADLLEKSQDGSLTLRIGDNLKLCASGDSCVPPPRKKSPISPITVIVPIVVVVLVVAAIIAILALYRRRNRRGVPLEPDREPTPDPTALRLECRQFTYKELEVITNNFDRELGRGGFGAVHKGVLEDGIPVAVKTRSQAAQQGIKQFLAEAKNLSRVHHKNLVSLIGYCRDGDCLALVYELMSEGTLKEHLKGKSGVRLLSWRERLRIALESAQGLEYLHTGCRPPLVHRDVKTSNILLNAKLEAKVADFGLSKALYNDIRSHETTAVVGTPGYIDPEYYVTYQLSEKSDVYSFGVVLLEAVTGRPAILPGPQNVTQWVQQRLARGNIESITDARMRGKYDINSVWKVAELGLRCTAQSASERPTMPDVVMQLKESLDLEDQFVRASNYYSTGDNLSSETGDVSRSTGEHLGMIPEARGPTVR